MARKKPVEFSEEIAEEICAELSSGESLVAICSKPGMPDQRTVYRWCDKNQEFNEQYESAMRRCAHALLHKGISLMLEEPKDHVQANHRRNQAGFFLQAAARLNPRRFSERIEVAGDPEAPLGIPATFEQRRELARQVAFMLASVDAELAGRQAANEAAQRAEFRRQQMLRLPMAERVGE